MVWLALIWLTKRNSNYILLNIPYLYQIQIKVKKDEIII